MMMIRSNRLTRPFSNARDEVASTFGRTSGWSIFGVVLALALIAVGVWAWPEVQRTIRMHRM